MRNPDETDPDYSITLEDGDPEPECLAGSVVYVDFDVSPQPTGMRNLSPLHVVDGNGTIH